MNKSVMEMCEEIKTLWVERDNILYPSSDNTALAYVKLYAMLATQIEFELPIEKIRERLEKEITEAKAKLKEVQ